MSGAIVVRGDPGIGKTALLEAATAETSGITLIRSDGFEAELSIPYAGLHRLGLSLIEHIDALPARQRQALHVAWGTDDGPAPDRFLVGLGMLTLFAEAGRKRAVVCVIDDAHWLDSESRDVLGFVARRLHAESTALMFAARDDDETEVQLAGIPSIQLSGLDPVSAVQLLTTTAPGSIDPLAATGIATATGGNPLALIELARDHVRRPGELSLSLDPVPISRLLETYYLRRVRDMTHDVQNWLLLVAAQPAGHPELITAAAATRGLSSDCAAEAQRAGLVTVGDTVVFRHPLVRSAVYGAALGTDRRDAHAVLANEAERLGLVELEAWHAAEATLGTDTAVAGRLETVAALAAKRGGLASQARLLARAADLSPAGAKRNDRLLAAAEAAGEAGAAQMSRQLLDRIEPDGLDRIQRGRMTIARSALAVFMADPAAVVNGPADMLKAADDFHGHEPEREQRALLRAFELSLMTELLMERTTLPELGYRLEAGAALKDGPFATALRALSAHILLPYADAVPLMRETLDMLSALDDDELPSFGFIGIALTTALFDEEAGASYLSRLARIARDDGSLRALDTVLWVRSIFELGRGDPAACGRYVEQVRELRRAIGYEAENVVNVSHLAWTGIPSDQVKLLAEVTRSMGFGGVTTSAKAALAIRDIAEGHYRDAYLRLRPMVENAFLQVTYLQLADYVEAAVRSGHLSEAASTAQTITAMAEANGTAWLRGIDRRCRAVLATDENAETNFLRSIEILSTASVPADLGRAHLLYGEWLRRTKRRRDAREQLRAAVEIFDRINAPAFAARARNELAATGEKTSKRQTVAGVAMSPREAAVAFMAADGHTNAEIGAALFISTNTVDYHLRKVFGKLGISSRRQLGERFDDAIRPS